MSEAVEYRVCRCQQVLKASAGTVVAAIGVIAGMIVSMMSPADKQATALLIVVLLFAAAALLLWEAHAMGTDGWARRLYELKSGERDDPPLDEWAESLDERGAFGGGGESG